MRAGLRYQICSQQEILFGPSGTVEMIAGVRQFTQVVKVAVTTEIYNMPNGNAADGLRVNIYMIRTYYGVFKMEDVSIGLGDMDHLFMNMDLFFGKKMVHSIVSQRR